MPGVRGNQYEPNPSKFDRFHQTFSFFWNFAKKFKKQLAQQWNIFQQFPNAPAPRHPGTLPPSKSSSWRCRTTKFHPDWTKWRPSYAHLKFQTLTFFINIRSLPPLPRKIHGRKDGKHHLPPVFLLNHLYPIFPPVPFVCIVWDKGQKASRQMHQKRHTCIC